MAHLKITKAIRRANVSRKISSLKSNPSGTKIFNFYNLSKDLNLGYNTLKEKFCSRIRKLISKEKNISMESTAYEAFESKWEKFVSLYDFRGPDFDQI